MALCFFINQEKQALFWPTCLWFPHDEDVNFWFRDWGNTTSCWLDWFCLNNNFLCVNRRTGTKRPTTGPYFGKRFRDRNAERYKRKPPRGMHINHDDIVALAGSSNNQDELLSNMDREIVALLSQVSKLNWIYCCFALSFNLYIENVWEFMLILFLSSRFQYKREKVRGDKANFFDHSRYFYTWIMRLAYIKIFSICCKQICVLLIHHCPYG